MLQERRIIPQCSCSIFLSKSPQVGDDNVYAKRDGDPVTSTGGQVRARCALFKRTRFKRRTFRDARERLSAYTELA